MDSFLKIFDRLKGDLKIIDNIILDFSKGKSPLISEIANHLISSGGKRIRPILLIICARLCGSKDDDCQHILAAAVELIHSATLLHDDVVDSSEVRRGKKTANAIWDNKSPILVGDYLFSVAFQLMVKSKNLRVLDLLAKSSSIMADGEVMQLENSNDIEVSQDKYLEIIYGKTAVLFKAACEVGPIINNLDEKKVRALSDFGKNLGIIFQIVDDILDYNASQNNLGKDIGNDFFEGKVTLPIIFAYEDCNIEEKKEVRDMFFNNLESTEKNTESFEKILKIMSKYDSIEKSKELAFNYHKQALDNLSVFQDSSYKQDLENILDFSLFRIK